MNKQPTLPRTGWLVLLLCTLFLLTAHPVAAHAVLQRSEPIANANFLSTPSEIRLWFTEPLEVKYSAISLYTSEGVAVTTVPSVVDKADPRQMYLPLGELADGVYTVVWRMVSTTGGQHVDGHYSFTVGASVALTPLSSQRPEKIPVEQAQIRWFNLLSLVLLVGSLGFICFVWEPAGFPNWPPVQRRMWRAIWISWWLVGVSSVLMLLFQTARFNGISWREAAHYTYLRDLLQESRYGAFWSVRMILWAWMGGLLLWADRRAALRWGALILGAGILLVRSLYSHASLAQDMTVAVASNWLHLLFSALWIGGLVQIFTIIQPMRRSLQLIPPVMGRLIGCFANYVRITIAGLLVTGVYASWLHLGSFDALVATLYGRTLLVKLLLLVPLLIVAAINLVWTRRRLLAEKPMWVGWLRSLVALEIGLATALLIAVGVLTSITPARTELIQRMVTSSAGYSAARPWLATIVADDLQIHLAITPGWVGANTMFVALYTLEEEPVTDASLIHVRFTPLSTELPPSELHITAGEDGIYPAQTSHLNTVGDWQIELTIQRPGKADTFGYFAPQMVLRPAFPSLTDLDPPRPYRAVVLWSMGVWTFGLGCYFVAQQGWRFWQDVGLLATSLMMIGGLFLANLLL